MILKNRLVERRSKWNKLVCFPRKTAGSVPQIVAAPGVLRLVRTRGHLGSGAASKEVDTPMKSEAFGSYTSNLVQEPPSRQSHRATPVSP